MAANKANYIILYKNSAQVYAATSLSTALKTPLPKGCTKDDKIVMFMSYLPDEKSLCIYPLDEEQLTLKEEAPQLEPQTQEVTPNAQEDEAIN